MKVIWLGEDELHAGGAGPSFTLAFGGIKFPKGEAVDVADKAILARLKKNQFFEVDGKRVKIDEDKVETENI